MILDSIELNVIERDFIEQWLWGQRPAVLEGFYKFFLQKEHHDDFLYCYTADLQLTDRGRRLKNECYAAQSKLDNFSFF